MKTAVCVSGQLRTLEFLPSMVQRIIEPLRADVFVDSWIPTDVNINDFVAILRPKMLHLEYMDDMPLAHQIRNTIPKHAGAYDGQNAHEIEKTENIPFMWYKIWRCNELMHSYEEFNRIRYDRVIRMRTDITVREMPDIRPTIKTLYIPTGNDHRGGLCDLMALGDPQTMDLYCDLYNNIHRYLTLGVGLHPESLLRRHVEINRLAVERFECHLGIRSWL